MITREHYISKLREFYDSDLIKIITGIRRSGKSIILKQIMDELKNQNAHVFYLNFEDYRILSQIPDADSLIKYFDERIVHGEQNYLFLDEIQEVKDWHLACRTLRLEEGVSIFITGSNSKLLSGEFTSELGGRHVTLRVRPFVYKEILAYSKELGFIPSVSDYLVWGGFPKRFEFKTAEARDLYLQDLVQSIVEKDLIARYHIENTDLFRRVARFVLRSNARIFSARSIESYLKNEHIVGSVNTIIKYLSYLEEAYVIDRISPYSERTKADLKYTVKIYNADPALNSINVTDGRFDVTHNLENIVYNELIYMGYDLRVLGGEDGELDFVAVKGGKKYCIQVAYSVAEDKVYDREMSAFKYADVDAEKILITNDEFDYSTALVRHIRLPEFLVMEHL